MSAGRLEYRLHILPANTHKPTDHGILGTHFVCPHEVSCHIPTEFVSVSVRIDGRFPRRRENVRLDEQRALDLGREFGDTYNSREPLDIELRSVELLYRSGSHFRIRKFDYGNVWRFHFVQQHHVRDSSDGGEQVA